MKQVALRGADFFSSRDSGPENPPQPLHLHFLSNGNVNVVVVVVVVVNDGSALNMGAPFYERYTHAHAPPSLSLSPTRALASPVHVFEIFLPVLAHSIECRYFITATTIKKNSIWLNRFLALFFVVRLFVFVHSY